MNVLHERMIAGEFLPGIYDVYSNSEYHAAEGVSKSDLDLIHKSPAHLKGAQRIETPAMRLGTAFHCATLEPERFKDAFAVVEGDRRTKAVKDEIRDLAESGWTVLTADEMDIVQAMSASVYETKIGAALLKSAQKEHSVFAEIDGVRVKCRPDGWDEARKVIFDLKSTEDASPEGFARSVARYRYHVQDAFYRHVMSEATGTVADDYSFIFIAVEKSPPYAVAFYQLDDMATLQGWVEARSDLRRYRDALESGKWNGYSPKIETLSLPRWAVITE